MNYLNVVLGVLAVLSFALTFWRWMAARRFPLHARSAVVHVGAEGGEFRIQPGVTLLKPLKGADHETRNCLQSWLTQAYTGQVQILFVVASAEDEACTVVHELLAACPQADAQLVICPERRGANSKVSKLVQAESHIQHEIVIISDADVFVPPDFLVNVVQSLAGPKTAGLVNCFYRLANPTTPAMHWEAICINADFWTQVLQAKSCKKVDFALGAVMATTRTQLKNIGGFQALADYLADDYQLGHQISKHGDIVFCPVVVDCREKPMNWKQVFLHQLRWARTIRVCQPLPFFFSILNNATIWPLLWWLIQPTLALWHESDGQRPFFVPFTLADMPLKLPTAFCLAFAIFRIGMAMDCQHRLTRSEKHYAWAWLVPIKDLLEFVIWALAFIGNKIEWRGERYHVLAGGKLEKV